MNLFATYASKQLFQLVLVSFFCMQTLFSYVGNLSWFADGYSPIPLIGLYLLARYIRIYQPRWSMAGKNIDLLVYLFLSLVMAILSFFLIRRLGSGCRMFNYTNPLVIVSSVFFVLFFSKLRVSHLPLINWMAGSSLGVYLFHTHPCIMSDYFLNSIPHLLRISNSGIIKVLLCLGFLVTIFFIGVLIDRVRLHVWNALTRFLPKGTQ